MKRQPYKISGLPGDGIGPEVLQATLLVLDAACAGDDAPRLSIESHDAGADHYRRNGEAFPSHVRQACLDADAVLLAAIGLPDVRKPDGTEVQPEMMMGLRQSLGLYAAVRPVKLYPGIASPLRDVENGIDLVILRENLEGLFASFGGGCLLNDHVATDTIIITREGTERIVDFAFQLARKRNGRPLDGRKSVTCVDKANVFRSFAFFRKIFFEQAAKYSDIAADAIYVDAMSLFLVQNPAAYDVLVMENQFGDILSDLGAGIVGGLGMGPSAEIGNDHALFQPSHGSAPQLTGKNVANPIATILSAAMMLEWLSDRHQDPSAARAASRIEEAVSQVLAEGQVRTPDIGGTSSTSDVAEAVAAAITNSNRVSV